MNMENTVSQMLSVLCCCGRTSDYEPIAEKSEPLSLAPDNYPPYRNITRTNGAAAAAEGDTSALARHVVQALLAGDKAPLRAVDARLASSGGVRASSWADGIAQGILDRLVDAVKPGSPIGDALRETYDVVHEAAIRAFGFAKDHPVFVVALALGILCLMAPWVVHVLGFAQEGVIAGSWAARWQSTFGGIIEEGSLFAWLQSFGALH